MNLLHGALAALALASTLACGDKEAKDSSKAEPAAKMPETAVAETAADAAPAEPAVSEPALSEPPVVDRSCPVLGRVEAGGIFGDTKIPRKAKRHPGIKRVYLRSSPAGQLYLAALGKDDAENELGLAVNAISPQRAVQVYRYSDQTWEDLGRPFRFVGWGIKLDEILGAEDPGYAVEAGLGDVRKALVTRCESGRWSMSARYDTRDIDAIALLATERGAENLYRLKGPVTRLGEQCKLDSPLAAGGGLVPVALRVPPYFAGSEGATELSLADEGDCRLARKFETASNGRSLATIYERCSSKNGGDFVAIEGCGLKGLWFDEARREWVSLPGIEDLGAESYEKRHAVAVGSQGPIAAVTHAKGLTVYRFENQAWSSLPPLPGAKGCALPISVEADPIRLVTRSCSGYGKLRAFHYEEGRWHQASSSALSLKPAYGAQQRPDVSAAWLGTTPYVAIGYYGAPVVRVYEAEGKGWGLHLQSLVDAVSP